MNGYLRAYVGQSRGAAMIRRLEAAGLGEMTVRGELPPRRHPWAFDNGAYRDWKAGTPFNFPRFEQDLDWIQLHGKTRPDFIVAPDIVAGGPESLCLSRSWLPRIAGRRIGTSYLAVQDGMDAEVVASVLEGFGGLFVGGTTAWKLATGAVWVKVAHRAGLKCHVARVSSMKRVRWAYSIGADSIDSCQPLRSFSELERFIRALGSPELIFNVKGAA